MTTDLQSLATDLAITIMEALVEEDPDYTQNIRGADLLDMLTELRRLRAATEGRR